MNALTTVSLTKWINLLLLAKKKIINLQLYIQWERLGFLPQLQQFQQPKSIWKKNYFYVTMLRIYSHNFAIIQSQYYNFTVTTLPLYTIFPLSSFNTNILQSQLRHYPVTQFYHLTVTILPLYSQFYYLTVKSFTTTLLMSWKDNKTTMIKYSYLFHHFSILLQFWYSFIVSNG